MKVMIVINVDKCLGCKSCEIACAVEHSSSRSLLQAIRESPAPRARVSVRRGVDYSVPLQCRQCDNAPCVEICPAGALERDDPDSPVVVREDRCVGCNWCTLACPFGVIRVDAARGAVIKCDQCVQRVQRGEPPACVAACPTGALGFKALDEILEEKRDACLVLIERGLTGGET